MSFKVRERTCMSLLRVVIQKLFYQFLCLFVVDELRKSELTLHDFFINIVWSFSSISKRQNPTQELIQTNSKRPQINKIVIPFSKNDIRSHIVRSANNGEGFTHLIILCPDNFRSSQINQLHVSFWINHKILRFDISANYLIIIEIFKDKDDSCSIKLTILCWQQTYVPHHFIEILSTDILS